MFINQKTILITGGYGFIGSALCKRLIEDNHIIIIDNETRNALKFTDLGAHRNLTMVTADILDKNKLLEVVTNYKPQIVIHLAAVAGVTNYLKHPIKTMEVNFVGTYHLMEVLKTHPPEHFINVSTSEVYGPFIFRASEDNLTTQGSVTASRWTYSVSKLAAEHLCFAYQKEHDIPVTSMRPFNVYGPGQVGEGAIQVFAPLALKNKDIFITNDGNQIRAWCYIDDMIDAVILCLCNKNAIGQVFNIGNPNETTTIRGLVEKIIKITDSQSKIKFVSHPGVDVELRVPSIKKAQDILGFLPKTDLNSGLLRAIEWYRDFMLPERIQS